jgi:hypothetical protein
MPHPGSRRKKKKSAREDPLIWLYSAGAVTVIPPGDFHHLDCCGGSQDHLVRSPPLKLERLEILLLYPNLVTWLKGMNISG